MGGRIWERDGEKGLRTRCPKHPAIECWVHKRITTVAGVDISSFVCDNGGKHLELRRLLLNDDALDGSAPSTSADSEALGATASNDEPTSTRKPPVGPDDALSTLGRAALKYACELGFAVFPCRPKGKEPITPNGFKDATRDPEQIKKWWKRNPDANVGIATGIVSGLVVLDVDPRHGGDDVLAELEAQHGRLPDTPRVLTGGGGVHYFFKHPGLQPIPNSAGKVGPGLDVRGDGGYVLAPPSIHPNGNKYCWEISAHVTETPLAEVP